jgi:hypothetical protein
MAVTPVDLRLYYNMSVYNYVNCTCCCVCVCVCETLREGGTYGDGVWE